jgi:L-ascorbate metabolism protein UlaG (beta-lactamase superfamily)
MESQSNSKVQIRWLGHAGFKITFPDPKDAGVTRTIYVDTWLDGPTSPADVKGTVPTDADLVLVTHGHFDHSVSAPALVKASTKKDAKIYTNGDIGKYFTTSHAVPAESIDGGNKGGTITYSYCTVTMVSADHSSGCMTDHGLVQGGEPAGFVIKGDGFCIYHAGDTNVFSDMDLISDLYKPTHALIPIGGHYTMGPNEAAYAVARYLLSVQVVIPMHFGTFPALTGTVEEFEKHLAHHLTTYKRTPTRIVDPHTLHEKLTDLPQLQQ